MATQFSKFVIREAIAIAALNSAINASYTWLLWRSLNPLTLFGENGVAADLSLTPVFIGLLSTLLGTSTLRRRLGDSRMAAGRGTGLHPSFQLLPHNILARSAVIGVGCGLLLGTPIWLFLQATGIEELSLAAACGLKIALTIPLSLLIVPFVVLCARADVSSSRGSLATS